MREDLCESELWKLLLLGTRAFFFLPLPSGVQPGEGQKVGGSAHRPPPGSEQEVGVVGRPG